MAIRDILVGIDGTTAGESLLRSALGLARDHKAYLAAAYCMAVDHAAAVLAGAPVNPSPGIFVAPEVLTARGDTASDPFPQISHEAQIAERVEHLFWDELQGEGLDGEWHLFGSNTVRFIELAKSFDLTILRQLSSDARSIGFPPGETVVASGRPVLVIPYAETVNNVGRRALIAWDGTREAVRAVHGALPLLDRAEAVTVHICRRSTGKSRAIPSFSRLDFQSSKAAPGSRPTRGDFAECPFDIGGSVIARRRYIRRSDCLGCLPPFAIARGAHRWR
jgi:nucleotide-binding universal stress UspA family protein